MSVGRIWEVYATVTSVYDGDTFHADLDLGWKVWHLDQRVRIQNISAPEYHAAEGMESKATLMTYLAPGDIVKLHSTKLDQYGRTLALVTLSDGRDVGELMIAEGAAVPWV